MRRRNLELLQSDVGASVLDTEQHCHQPQEQRRAIKTRVSLATTCEASMQKLAALQRPHLAVVLVPCSIELQINCFLKRLKPLRDLCKELLGWACSAGLSMGDVADQL